MSVVTTPSSTVVGVALFTLLTVWSVTQIRRKEKNKGRRSGSHRYRRSVAGLVGPRGERALAPPIPYLNQFLTCLNNQCDPETNPFGHVALCVAENKLVLDLVSDWFMKAAPRAFSDTNAFTYTSFLGAPIAREAAAYFLARRFLFPSKESLTPQEAWRHINPENLGFAAGCAAHINHLFFLLGDKGDCALIPIPYYAAFENDMNLVAGVEPFGVEQANPSRGPTTREWDIAYDKAIRQGLRPKFILLTNPNNPLGTIYSPDVLKDTVEWARERKIHTIVDEIYALSTHKPANHGFQSIIRVLDNNLGNDVHFLWALSKDLGGSGLRIGLLYSQNKVLIDGLATVSIFAGASGPMQYLTAELLTDDNFLDSFLEESRTRIRTSYEICTLKLNEMVIPFIPAEAGLFVYVDFSSLLPEKTFQYERELSDLFFKYGRFVLTPGVTQRDVRPGMFRICYAWVSPEVLAIAMERLSKMVAKIRRMDWNDLGDRAFAGIMRS